MVFFDLETTGLDFVHDKIIEMSCIKVDNDLNVVDTFYSRFNPEGVAINPGAKEKHCIDEEDLVNEPFFFNYADRIIEFFGDDDIAGYNIKSFDIPFLYTKLLECNKFWNIKDKKIIDVYRLYKKYNSGKLEEVYKRYVGKQLDNAHNANADTEATIEIFKAQRDKGEVFESDEETELFKRMVDVSEHLIRVDTDNGSAICINFGKHKGKRIDEVDRSYLEWVVKSDFPIDLRMIITKYLNAYE